MSERLTNQTFEQWLELTFGKPGANASAHQSRNANRWAGPPAVAVEYISRAFENAAEVLAPYQDAQLADVFWRGLSFSPLIDNRIPMGLRQRCIRSVYSLFEQCFARRCEPHLSHLERTETNVNPLNGICYMWWDIRPISEPLNPSLAELTAEYLNVLRRTLLLDSIACQESALHGLSHGHWDFGIWRDKGDPKYGIATDVDETTEIIDEFLARSSGLNPALKRYALAAREGMVQ